MAVGVVIGIVLGLAVGVLLGLLASGRQATHTAAARRQMAGEFAELSQEALQRNTEQFLSLADTKLQAARKEADSDLERRREAVDGLVRPLREKLDEYDRRVQDLERHRAAAQTGLTEHLKRLEGESADLRKETQRLATALRSPAVRGRWGELQLRKVVELAGMLEHCDFDVQVSAGEPSERLRPDMVVHLPGAKNVVVDAKVPLEAFERATMAETEEERRALMAGHARQVRSHIDALAKKAYWRQVEPSPEFVVAFIPGDPLLAAAFEHDPGLIEYAVANHVLPATPTTLISLLWAVAYGWRQDALADNAREVQRLGSELYQRLATMSEHLSRLGRSLGASVDAYNKSVRSIESRVLPTARRFPDLGVGGGERAVADLEPLEALPVQFQTPELTGVGSVPGGSGGGPGVGSGGEDAGGEPRDLGDGVAEVR